MVQINFASREINCKIVYYGPGRCGKTTNLQLVHEKAPANSTGELVSIATETDRTLYFDFLPLDLGTVAGMRTKFQLYTVPGQVYYDATRKLVLQGCDGVVFVADSNPDLMAENIESLDNLATNLRENGLDIMDLPIVLQFNKRDLPKTMTVDEMTAKLNRNNWPVVEAVAVNGDGVFQTLKAISQGVIKRLNREQGYTDEGKKPPRASALAGNARTAPAASISNTNKAVPSRPPGASVSSTNKAVPTRGPMPPTPSNRFSPSSPQTGSARVAPPAPRVPGPQTASARVSPQLPPRPGSPQTASARIAPPPPTRPANPQTASARVLPPSPKSATPPAFAASPKSALPSTKPPAAPGGEAGAANPFRNRLADIRSQSPASDGSAQPASGDDSQASFAETPQPKKGCLGRVIKGGAAIAFLLASAAYYLLR